MSKLAADVTFYIPVRNCERTLPAALESVENQTVQPAVRLLVVDARSTDNTIAIAQASGWEIVWQHDGRHGAARNLAISACRTRYLASCDADVTLEADWLEQLLARFQPGIAAVGGRTEERIHTPADAWRAENMPHNWGPGGFDNPFMLVSEMVAEVAALRSIGGYRGDLCYYEDSDLCQRLRQADWTLRYEPGAVAWHDRRDTVQSVLDLRWNYAAYRQREKLDSIAGICAKLAVNRTYTLQALSRSLCSVESSSAADSPEIPRGATAAISLALWYHHALRDLSAVLDKWPLLTPAARRAAQCAAIRALRDAGGATWWEFHDTLPTILPSSFADLDCARSVLPGGGAEYREQLTMATRGLLGEIGNELAAPMAAAARWLTTPDAPPPELPRTKRCRRADARTLPGNARPAWEWDELAARLQVGIDAPIAVIGPSLADEAPRQNPYAAHDSTETVLIPHLEAHVDPLRAVREALSSNATARRAAIAYQAPDTFDPAIPWLNARDLASTAVACGYAIEHFFTRAGLTRLVLRRACEVAPSASQKHEHSVRQCV